jgi:hypothetical protein
LWVELNLPTSITETNFKGYDNLIKVVLVRHPLIEYDKRSENLEIALNDIDRDGGTILYITSDNDGYTVVYREKSKVLNE